MVRQRLPRSTTGPGSIPVAMRRPSIQRRSKPVCTAGHNLNIG
ncbi:hypothetical protein NY08_3994 [Rhodococcus sp. B7740]|nr:hypothetical protein NY08_3994 [Rhodococcus sp. B7740]